MHVAATPEQSGTILGAMLAIASSGGTPTEADRASVAAAGRYIFKLDLARDLAGVTPPGSEALRELAADPAIADEAVRFATVMAFIDGVIDRAKLEAVLNLAAVLAVREDFVDDVKQMAQGHLRNATAHMIRANLESLTGRPWNTDDVMPWLLPYKARPDGALAARFRALGSLPPDTFGFAFAAFYQRNKYAFPGDEAALNASFAIPHDSTHVRAGYDTSPRGELLTSVLAAAMHRSHAMSGHVPAGDCELASGHSPQRGCRRRHGSARSAGILARMGARRRRDRRLVRSGLGFLGRGTPADRGCARRDQSPRSRRHDQRCVTFEQIPATRCRMDE
jgi:hypothetical protein